VCVCVCVCVCQRTWCARVRAFAYVWMQVCACVCVVCVCARQNFGSSPLYACLCVSVSVSMSVCIRTSASRRGGGRPAVCKAVGHRDFIREAEEDTMGRLQQPSILQIFLCLGGVRGRYYFILYYFIFI
jgi:hypothetical protein